jgi:hypothetical protein
MNKFEIDFYVKLRDAHQMAADAINEYIESQAPQEVKAEVAVREETFTLLTFREYQGAKLGPFGLASLTENDSDKFNYALGILGKNKATIEHRYHSEGFAFSYWAYQGLIYRQKLKAKT